jgi:hypothetical protein
MIKFKINDVEYQLPEIISIGNYAKIFKIKDLFSDDYFAAKLVSIMTGAKQEELLESDYQNVHYLANYILTLIPQEKPKFEDRFVLDGVNYGFFPKWEELTFAEFVDMDTISTKKPEELLDLLHILTAIMYRPIISEKSTHDFQIEKYDVNTMKVRAELFKNKLDVRYVLGAQHFFIKFVNRYLGYSQLSSIPKLSIWTRMKLVWSLRKILWRIAFRKSSDGILSSTELLQTILQNTTISTKKR